MVFQGKTLRACPSPPCRRPSVDLTVKESPAFMKPNEPRNSTGANGRRHGQAGAEAAHVDRRTTYERAVAAYDAALAHALVEEITTTIFDVSRTTDANCVALRTGETVSALLTVLASTLALSPAAVRSPTALRRTIDELGKRLRRKVAAAANNPDFAAFKSHCFDNDREGGNA